MFFSTPPNHLFFPKDITRKSTISFCKKFNEVDGKYENILIFIHSHGGECDCAIAIVDKIKQAKSKIITVAYKQCLSGAGFVFIHGHKRFVVKDTLMLIHPQQVSIDWCAYNVFMEFAEIVKSERKALINGYCDRTFLPPKMVEELCTSTEKIFTATEMVDYGIADMIIDNANCIPNL